MSKRNLFSHNIAVAAIAAVMLGASNAGAWVPSIGASPSIPQPSPVDCRKYTLTADKFMDAFHSIAMHGDLRDIPFIEKTLQLKFDSKQGGGNPHRMIYRADSLFSAPIYLYLDVSDDNDDKNLSNGLAALQFTGPQNVEFFQQCMHISIAQFSKKFRGEINPDTVQISTHGHYFLHVHKQLTSVGENPKLGVSYNILGSGKTDVKDDSIISEPTINQLK
jgi:hypothetical protein